MPLFHIHGLIAGVLAPIAAGLSPAYRSTTISRPDSSSLRTTLTMVEAFWPTAT